MPQSGPAPASRTLRIAICLEDLAPLRRALDDGVAADGAYLLQAHVATGLRSRGHRLTFLAPRESGDIERATDLGRPEVVARTWSTRAWFTVAGAAAWRMQRWLGVPYLNVFSNYRLLDACLRCLPGHDVVYERNALYSLGVARACRRLGLPHVVFFDADQLVEQAFIGSPLTGLLRWRAGRILRYNLRAADCIICVSDAARGHLLHAWGADPGKTVVCPNGVDVGRFRPDPGARAELRARLGLGTRPVVLFAGSFYEWHDVATLIDAFAILIGRVPDARMILVGHGRLWEAMRQRAHALSLSAAVQFSGLVPHSEVPGLLAAADIAVAPYPRLSRPLWQSPLKLFEYMASGVAVVASDAGQVGQVIRNAQNGLLVEPGNVPALATALEALMTDGGLRSRLGAQAREDVVREHSWERYLDRLESLFQAVIERRPVASV